MASRRRRSQGCENMVTHNATILEQHLLLASDFEQQPQQEERSAGADLGKTCRRRSVHNKEDPMSHRIIEKRRRDRMNNCLADLARLVPADYLKKGRGRVEKTEIIEMAIKHMKHLQAHACRQVDSCELAQQQQQQMQQQQMQLQLQPEEPPDKRAPISTEHYRLGYQECLSETMLFLVEVEGFFAGDPLCVQLISHLQKHCDNILKGDRLNCPRASGETSSSSGSSGGIPLGASGLSTGSPGSGSSSDSSGRTENRDSGVGTGDPAYEEGIINLSGSSSQLREMLTGPKLSAAPAPSGQILHRRLQHPAHSPAPAPGGGSAASLYKFKNNIKQRFSAEHHGDEAAAGRKRHALDEDSKSTLTLSMLGRRDSDTCSVSSVPHSPPLKFPRLHSPPASPPPAHRPLPAPSYGVPIFALDLKGSYYVPLTLDVDVLAPYLAQLGFEQEPGGASGSVNAVLHPVTISVNFQRALRTSPQRQRCAPVSPWKTESLDFAPRWSVCSTDRG
ncbi:uncharacterized protein LOC134533165 isoform X2 [Bacillus rossius redtenbacheri]|uniref:uncharacterized protein LOC134533165 isoform X2 n=1 Tax=Bacillus rossius redtenbacheri TaxID=93214 RepID=UPI002FDE521C